MKELFTGCEFLAGWFSGVCGLLVGHPMDTIKVHQQSMDYRTNVASDIYKKEGVLGFYKGLASPLFAAGVYNSIFFGVFSNTLRVLEVSAGQAQRRFCCENAGPVAPYWHTQVFLAGCIGGLASVSVGCPAELVKTQLQVQTAARAAAQRSLKPGQAGHFKGIPRVPVIRHEGPISCLANLYRLGGLKMCYKGGVMMLWRDIPAFGVYTLTYEHLVCICRKSWRFPKLIADIIAGGTAGTLSWMVVMPFDVIKSRLQSDNILRPRYNGAVDCFLQSYKSDGPRIFLRGAWVTLLRAFPTNALTFVGYEIFLKGCETIKHPHLSSCVRDE